MKAEEFIEKLRELKNKHIEFIDPGTKMNNTGGMAYSNWQLMMRIADLIKTSKMAIEGIPDAGDSSMVDPELNIGEVLGITLRFLPYSEMRFVDEVLALLQEMEDSDLSSELS